MAETTAIEWTDATWNPVRGCTKVSAGCKNCYAETVAARFSGPGQPYEGTITNGAWNGHVRIVPEHLDDPCRWKKPRRIFVNSMSDLFHEAIPYKELLGIWQTMKITPRHTFQILTKRPMRMLELVQRLTDAVSPRLGFVDDGMYHPARPLPNVWLGVSVEDQKAADLRIPALLETPAAVRFLSCEPLLGDVDLRSWLNVCPVNRTTLIAQSGDTVSHGWGWDKNNMRGTEWAGTGLGWVIAGGESGHGARPMDLMSARKLRDQCAAADVPFFFKQWGEWMPSALEPEERNVRVGKKSAGRLLDGRTWDGFPA